MNHVIVALNRVGRTILAPYPCSIKRPYAALAENRNYIATDDVIILFSYWSKSSTCSSVPVSVIIIIVYKVYSVLCTCVWVCYHQLYLVRVQVVQSCDRMVSSGVAYMEDCRTFSGSVKELAAHFEKGEAVSVSCWHIRSMRRYYFHGKFIFIIVRHNNNNYDIIVLLTQRVDWMVYTCTLIRIYTVFPRIKAALD